ncbi:MAG: phage tail sheath family protein [Gammaproteobacteria bacterium]
MPVQVSYPGVYIQEVPSGVRAITGVSTSIALFMGRTKRGRLNVPTRVLSFAAYERTFGTDTVISEMTDQVRQFFLNGGQQAFVMRIAEGSTAKPAEVTLKNQAGDDVLKLVAKDAGVDGNMLRAEVDYNTPGPESTFNLRVFREVVNAFGEVEVETSGTFNNLSMNEDDGRYVETIVNQQSSLVDAEDLEPAVLFAGYSVSGLVMSATATDADLIGLLTQTANKIQISVDGSPFVTVTLPSTNLAGWQTNSNAALNSFGVNVTVALVAAASGEQFLRITSNNPTVGSVVIVPAANNDATFTLQLGVGQGGFEVSGFAERRPAPSGFFANLGALNASPLPAALEEFVVVQAANFESWTLTDNSGGTHSGNAQAITFPANMYEGTAFDASAAPYNGAPFLGSLLNVRANLEKLGDDVSSEAITDGLWKADVLDLRLVLTPTYGDVNSDTGAALTSTGSGGTPYNIGAAGNPFNGSASVRSYSLGTTGAGTFQGGGADGQDGAFPKKGDYEKAFGIVDKEIDIFNLMILPRDKDQLDSHREAVWGPASVFCQQRRAFLIMDPRSAWTDADTVSKEIKNLRIGLVKDHTAIYWSRVKISTNGSTKTTDPSGSIAGLMARIDSNRGVWKAPAGIEADIRGIRGVEHMMSDPENGLINPQAVNAIRVFPNGIVSWGARTMDGFNNSGNDDYKYIPVRRLALFIEESLYRGLKFAVFEPNDEPLWAQIRLAAGAFMNNLFRQGAFQGQKTSDAYFVKVDSETTTQNDINLGIVNVVVGFAPIKPAEFVVITIQQMAGQVQT